MVDLNLPDLLLIMYSALMGYLRKIGIQWRSASVIYRLQQSYAFLV